MEAGSAQGFILLQIVVFARNTDLEGMGFGRLPSRLWTPSCYSRCLLGIRPNPTMSLERFGYREFFHEIIGLACGRAACTSQPLESFLNER
jgi:hypothetical protein